MLLSTVVFFVIEFFIKVQIANLVSFYILIYFPPTKENIIDP